MKLRTLFTINAVVTFLFGVGLLAVPATMLNLFTGRTPDALATELGRDLGALVFAMTVMSWLARKVEPSKGTNALVVGFNIAYVINLARQLGSRFDESCCRPQLALGLLGSFVQRGWAMPMFIGRWSASEGKRAQQRVNLAWFAEQVRAAVKWL